MTMRFIAAALAALLLALPAAAQRTGDAFEQDMLQRFRKAVPDSQFTLKADEPLVLLVKGGEWNEAQINLHRIDNYCRQSTADECDTAKSEFVRKLTAKREEPTRENLRLIVRDQEYLDYIGRVMPGKAGEDPAIHQPIGEGLYAFLAFDTPEAIGVIGDKTLKDLNLAPDAAWSLAHAQTRPDLPAMPSVDAMKQGLVFLEGEGYVPGLLIDLPAWERLAIQTGPDLFMAVLSDQLVVAGIMPDGPEFEKMKEAVEGDCKAMERCISPRTYRLRKGRWVIAR
ncbi:hypothetical protein P1X14_14275 [Sphingomonas sp. AOB5]|uniref:hypothetical protein n=1 Tax=Sphingomonas sp. AOB5 TaxID=3034017 RepID=UPI0023FA1179|nr:hypothetical protein [Sphingomonas sp. AOB5]MDF7776417.1 hypothetical protein [Sphingomonas sp. AOB5]